MLVLRAFRDAGCVSAGSPPSHPQAERSCETGGGRGIQASSFRLPFPFGLSGRRLPKRFGRWGHPESLLEQADWGGVAGAGVCAGGAKTGSRSRSLGGPPRGGRVSGRRAFPPPARPVSLWSGKKASHKTANKKRLSVAQTSPFRKNWLYARYKEESRFGRPCSPKVQRRPPHSALEGNLSKGGCNLWEPLAGDRRALSRKSPTNPAPGVSSLKT